MTTPTRTLTTIRSRTQGYRALLHEGTDCVAQFPWNRDRTQYRNWLFDQAIAGLPTIVDLVDDNPSTLHRIEGI